MSDWKKILGGIAPTLATAFGGPMAGAATKFVAAKLLGDENAGSKQIEDFVLSANPEALSKIKEIENEFKIEMERLGVDLEKIAADDRKDARKLGIETTLFPQSILSTVFVVGFFLTMYTLLAEGIKLTPAQEDIAIYLLGALTSGVMLVLKFWFGGSSSDTENMKNMYNSIPSHKVKR